LVLLAFLYFNEEDGILMFIDFIILSTVVLLLS